MKRIDDAVASRRKAMMVSGLRGLAQPKAPEVDAGPGEERSPGGGRASTAATDIERCDLCQTSLPPDHRHMLNLYERQIICVCEACWALRSGDTEFRPVGHRTLWLEDFHLPEEIWAQFRIPIGLAFFMYSSVTDCVVAMYPSPAGATESELHFETWNRLVGMNPVLERLEPDAEALIVNRMADPHALRHSADRPLLHAGGPDQGLLGGHLGRGRDGAGDRGLLRRAAGGLAMTQPQAIQAPVAPEPEFQILSAHGRRHAAVPAVEFDVHVSEPGGRAVYVIALSAMIMIEPARRSYDAETREKLVELFGAPERWATTTRSLVWHQADVLVPAFTGSTTFRVAVPASFDMEVASAKYLYGLPDGEVPLAFNFNGTVHYRGDDGRLQLSLIPWSCSAEFRFPVSVWRELMEHYYPRTGWVPVQEATLRALQREKAKRALPTLDACVAELLHEELP